MHTHWSSHVLFPLVFEVDMTVPGGDTHLSTQQSEIPYKIRLKLIHCESEKGKHKYSH